MDALRTNLTALFGGRKENEIAERARVGQTWLNRVMHPERGDGIKDPGIKRMAVLAEYFGASLDALVHGSSGDLKLSQPERLDDATIQQAFDLLYMLADARPEDKRFSRLSWGMVKIAAKGVERISRGQSQKEAIAEVLAELAMAE